ncbi:unnamed protein product [Caretta caretta]
MISRMEQGEMLWVLDHRGFKERETLRASDGMMRKYEEENPQQEGPEQVEQYWTLLERSQGDVSLSPEQEAACENEHRPENHQAHPRQSRIPNPLCLTAAAPAAERMCLSAFYLMGKGREENSSGNSLSPSLPFRGD